MISYLVSLSVLIAAVLIIRAFFKKSVAPRHLVWIWLAVVLRLVVPVSLFEMKLPVLSFPQIQQSEEKPSETSEKENPLSEPIDIKTPETVQKVNPIETASPVPAETLHEKNEPSEPSFPSPIKDSETSVETEKAKPGTDPGKSAVSKKTLLNLIWGAGSAVTGGWFLISGLLFRERLKKNRRYAETVGKAKVYLSPYAVSPCIIGPIPEIYLTEEAAGSSSKPYILKHEYTHFRRGDPFWSILRVAALTVHWYHPLVWAAAILSKQDGELACDDAIAVNLSENERIGYARAILNAVPEKKRFATGLGSHPIRERITALLNHRKNRPVCAVIALLLTLGVMGCSFGNPQPQTPEESTTHPTETTDTTDSADTTEPTDSTDPSEIPETDDWQDAWDYETHGCGPYIGSIESEDSPWIELSAESGGEPIARIPSDILVGWQKNYWIEKLDPEESAFYYAAFGEDRIAGVIGKRPRPGQGIKNIIVSHDGGKTWNVGENPYQKDFGGKQATCIGFVDADTVMMGFDHSEEYTTYKYPIVSRSADGGKTWKRVWVPVPDHLLWNLYLPESFSFNGNEGTLWMQVVKQSTKELIARIPLYSHDGGMTWETEVGRMSRHLVESLDPLEVTPTVQECLPAISALLLGDIDAFTYYMSVESPVYDDLRGMKIGNYRLTIDSYETQPRGDPFFFPVLELDILESQSQSRFFTKGTHRLVFSTGLYTFLYEYDSFIQFLSQDPKTKLSPAEQYLQSVGYPDFYVIQGEGRRQFGLCDFIAQRLCYLTGNDDYSPIPKEEFCAYAEKYLSVPGDSLSFYEGFVDSVDGGYTVIGRGRVTLASTFLSEEERDGMTVWTVQYWADPSESVPSQTVEYYVTFDGYEYTPIKSVVIADTGLKTASYGT